jgi:predicted NBD/HSP70 family sugar kinase
MPLAEIEKRVAIVMSGGTEGGLSPHLLIFSREEGAAAPAPRLAIGVGLTRAFKPEELGRSAQVEETAAAVTLAMRDAGIANPADVHFVQIKCPLLTKERIEEAARRGATTATDDTYHSMAVSRGASALGVALAGVINILDIPAVVLGGHLGQVADLLRPELERHLRSRTLSARWVTPDIVAAQTDPAPGATGAAMLELSTVLAHPVRWL